MSSFIYRARIAACYRQALWFICSSQEITRLFFERYVLVLYRNPSLRFEKCVTLDLCSLGITNFCVLRRYFLNFYFIYI